MTDKEKAIGFLVETKLGCKKLRDKELSDVCDISIKAIEKAIPKKPYLKDLFELGTMQGVACPVCDTTFLTTGEKYCKHCGQALDWSDEE